MMGLISGSKSTVQSVCSRISQSLILVHSAIICSQVLWGAGSIVAHLSLSTSNPILFSTIREFCAGVILTTYVHWSYYHRGSGKHNNDINPSSSDNQHEQHLLNTRAPVKHTSQTQTQPQTKMRLTLCTLISESFQILSAKLNVFQNKNNQRQRLHNDSYQDYKQLCVCGFCLYLGQLGYIIGLQLTSSITASSWQPFQGLLAIVYEYMLGMQTSINRTKVVGILIGTFGALFMVLYPAQTQSGSESVAVAVHGHHKAGFLTAFSDVVANDIANGANIDNGLVMIADIDTDTTTMWSQFGGSSLFFINCSASVFYLIYSSSISRKYGSLVITSYSYLMAAVFMFITLMLFALVFPEYAFYQFVCPDCSRIEHESSALSMSTMFYTSSISREFMYALVYYVICGSIMAYGLITWANQFLHPSNVTIYWILQPLSTVVISQLLLSFNAVSDCNGSAMTMSTHDGNREHHCLYGFGYSNLGAIPIIAGLCIVVCFQ